MAAPMKRSAPATDDSEDISGLKQIKLQQNASRIKLDAFLEWCKEHGFNLTSKVCLSQEGTCAQVGMVAVEDIPEGYCLFQIPRSCLLMPENSDIANILKKEADQLCATNQWIPLLITLLHEQSKPNSLWRSYLDLVPSDTALDLPMFWSRGDVEEHLKGTGVDLAVERDLKMIQSDYEKLVKPFFEKNQHLRSEVKDLEFFKKMVALVMAYSFTEPKHKDTSDKSTNGASNNDSDDDSDDEEEEEGGMLPPMMVPMADMLNHITKNNAKLTFGKEALKMVATRDIKKGGEVFNTYGQVSNLHLMHMYGFAEPFPDNTNDVVEIPVKHLLQAAQSMCLDDTAAVELLKAKWKALEEQDVIDDNEVVVLGLDGIITDEICVQVLKVLSMTKAEFADYQEQEGWSDAESDASLSGESKLSFDKMKTVDEKWKELLSRMADIHLEVYPRSMSEDEKRMESHQQMSSRERYSLFTAHGQKKLLWKLKDTCGGIKT